jgi:hypothetical protein
MLETLTVLAATLVAALGYHGTPEPARDAAVYVAAHPGSLERPDNETLALVVYWMHRESAFRNDAVGDGGRAHGVLQLHGACGLRSVKEQIGCWLAIVRQGETLCPSQPLAMTWGKCSSAPMADRRMARARAMLAAAAP